MNKDVITSWAASRCSSVSGLRIFPRLALIFSSAAVSHVSKLLHSELNLTNSSRHACNNFSTASHSFPVYKRHVQQFQCRLTLLSRLQRTHATISTPPHTPSSSAKDTCSNFSTTSHLSRSTKDACNNFSTASHSFQSTMDSFSTYDKHCRLQRWTARINIQWNTLRELGLEPVSQSA